MALQALLNDGDEVLVPAPDYPLWTAPSSACPAARRCTTCATRPTAGCPTSTTSSAKITPRTKAHRRHQPEQPDRRALLATSCSRSIVEIAREHGLVILADEVYDKIALRRREAHRDRRALRRRALTLTFNCAVQELPLVRLPRRLDGGLGRRRTARADYIEGLDMLARTCACARTCRASTRSRRRSAATRASTTWSCRAGACASSATSPTSMLTAIPGVSCVKPQAALYMFPKLDPKIYPIEDDQQFVLELLPRRQVLLVQGTGFNWPTPDHFRDRVPAERATTSREAISRIARFLERYRNRHSRLPTLLRRRICMKPIQVGLLGHRHGRRRHLQGAAAQPGRNQAPRRPRHRDHDGRRPRRRARARPWSAKACRWSADARAVIANPDIDIVVELIGGYGIARDAGAARRSPPASTWSPPTRRCSRCTAPRSSRRRARRA